MARDLASPSTKMPCRQPASSLQEMDSSNRNTALASAFVEELARSGVQRAVVSPGSRSTPLAVALWRESGIDVAVALDERSASFMALGAATASEQPVALLCTSGTAAANFHPAVAEADLSSVPLIVLTADRPPELRDNGSGQTIDQIKLFGSAVRWFCEVGTHEADDSGLIHMRSTACRAFATAAGDPRPGPVHLNFPWREPLAPITIEGQVTATEELALIGRRDQPLTEVTRDPPAIDDATTREIAELVNESRRPLIVAGRMGPGAPAWEICGLAQEIDAPVLAEPTSQLRFGPHDRSLVVTGYEEICRSAGSDLAPDLVIRFGEIPTSKQLRIWLASLGPETTQIVIDPGFSWNEPTGRANRVVRTDAGPLAAELTELAEGNMNSDWLDLWIDHLHANPSADDGTETISGPAIHRALGTTYSNGSVVYTASSMSIRDQEAHLGTGDARVLFLANRGANGIDGLVASGIGAAWATGRATTVITGDLGFQHDLGSLALLDQTHTPVRIVVVNDRGGAIFSRLPQKEAMDAAEFEAIMATPGHLDIEAAAASFGVAYRRIEESGDLEGQLKAEGQTILELVAEPPA